MSYRAARVRLADVKPLEDEYGNQFASRDLSLEPNKRYIEELAESFGAAGVPDVPILVVADGDGYRLKDGWCRYQAMLHRGTEECDVIVDDASSVQDVLETVVRTDVKKKYEGVEKSRFVQQLAAFGDDAYVSEVASIPAEKAARMRRARQIVGDRAEQMTLDRLYVIPDFEGDDEAVNELCGASEGEWKRVESRLRHEKEKREAIEAFRKRAKELRIDIVDERPTGLAYICQCEDADDLAGDYMAASVDYQGVVAMFCDNWAGVTLDFYGEPIGGEEADLEEAERRKLIDEYRTTAEKVCDSIWEWVEGQFDSADVPRTERGLPDTFMALEEEAHKRMEDDYWVKQAASLFPEALESYGVLGFAIGYQSVKGDVSIISSYYYDLADDDMKPYRAERLDKSLRQIAFHEADGWEPDEGMAAFLAMAREKVAAALGEDGDR